MPFKQLRFVMKTHRFVALLLLLAPVLSAKDYPRLEHPVVFQRAQIDKTGKTILAGKIWIMEADGSNQRQITFGPTYDEHPSVYADGEHVLYSEFRANGFITAQGARLVRLNIYTGVREIIGEEQGCALHHAGLSPVDDLLAYHRDCQGGKRVSQWIGLGDEAREIPFRATNGVRTRDGIIAMHEKNMNVSPREISLVFIPTDGEMKQMIRLTDEKFMHRRAAVSPDGRRMAWQTNMNGTDDEIYVADIRGEGARNLTNAPGDDGHPNYSRDGEWIVFESNRSGNWEIWRMRSDGSAQEQLTEGKGRYVSTRPRM